MQDKENIVVDFYSGKVGMEEEDSSLQQSKLIMDESVSLQTSTTAAKTGDEMFREGLYKLVRLIIESAR